MQAKFIQESGALGKGLKINKKPEHVVYTMLE